MPFNVLRFSSSLNIMDASLLRLSCWSSFKISIPNVPMMTFQAGLPGSTTEKKRCEIHQLISIVAVTLS